MKAWQSVLLRVVLFGVGLFVTCLPRWLELALGPPLGRLLLRTGGRRRKVAYDNIRHCFKELGADGWSRLLLENFELNGILVFELLHLFSPVPGHYARYARKIAIIDGVENWQKAYALGKGVIFVASHLGNWEMLVASSFDAGVPLTMVTKHLKPEWLHRKIEASRASLGVKAAYEPRTLATVMRALRNKEAVGFVVDQYAGPPIGIPVPFFGVKVGTLSVVGTLVARTGAVILPVKTYRDQNGMVRAQIEPMLDLGTLLQDEEKTTAALAGKVEQWVREYPAQWLWIHRRFKNVVWPDELA